MVADYERTRDASLAHQATFAEVGLAGFKDRHIEPVRLMSAGFTMMTVSCVERAPAGSVSENARGWLCRILSS